jgi:hypothetical protein
MEIDIRTGYRKLRLYVGMVGLVPPQKSGAVVEKFGRAGIEDGLELVDYVN